MLLNYHIAHRIVLGSLCVGDLVRLGLSSVRVAGLEHGHVELKKTRNAILSTVNSFSPLPLLQLTSFESPCSKLTTNFKHTPYHVCRMRLRQYLLNCYDIYIYREREREGYSK